MKKKFFKYIKSSISVMLIFCFVLPTFSSLTVTDGSSFVTKAEFDSSLADFNSRLTSFESGINSKIDAQVTTYLDRNGIWRGKEQTLLTDWGYTGLDSRIAGGHSESWGSNWGLNKDVADRFSMNERNDLCSIYGLYRISDTNASNKNEIISNITKSGLIIIAFDGIQETNSAGVQGINMMIGNPNSTTKVTIKSFEAGVIFSEQLNFYERALDAVDDSGDKKLYSFVNSALLPVPGVASLPDYPLTYLDFFVRRNTKLILELNCDVQSINAVGGSGIYVRHKWNGREAVIY